jgi:hypothetical protein
VYLTRDRVRESVFRPDMQRSGGSRELHGTSASTLSPQEGEHTVEEKARGEVGRGCLAKADGSQERMDAGTKKRTEESFTSAHWHMDPKRRIFWDERETNK